mmetsp:Transcript_894/g.1998  ORF Transcript_894/g.1998 Transcript_894/m.1998 type:complete len:113 (+) Transcript_894:538-876(+)
MVKAALAVKKTRIGHMRTLTYSPIRRKPMFWRPLAGHTGAGRGLGLDKSATSQTAFQFDQTGGAFRKKSKILAARTLGGMVYLISIGRRRLLLGARWLGYNPTGVKQLDKGI